MPNTRTRQRCRSSQRILRRCNTEKQGLSSLHGHTHPCMCYCLLPLYARILNTTSNPDGKKAGLFVFLPQKERSLECLRACFQGCVCSGLPFCFFLIACQLLRLFSDQPCSFTHSYFIELLYYQQWGSAIASFLPTAANQCQRRICVPICAWQKGKKIQALLHGKCRLSEIFSKTIWWITECTV